MLKFIRNLDFGWILILFAFVMALAGLSMLLTFTGGTTWLCRDPGCKLMQGYSLLALAVFMIAVGSAKIIRKG